jgi:hypothetical protein
MRKNYKQFEKFLQKIVLAQEQRHNLDRLFRILEIDYLYCNNIYN